MASAELQAAPLDGRFEFAHLTDPHLTSLAAVPAPLTDKRLLGWLSWQRRRRFRHLPSILAGIVADIDAAGIRTRLLTGDLTQIGLPVEIEAARDWLRSLGDPDDVMLVPGNHDRYVADPRQHLAQTWSPWLRGDEAAISAPAPAPALTADPAPAFPTLRCRGGVALIGLDSAVASPPLLATGRLGAAQLAALQTLLTRTGAAGYARIVLIHHAPLPGLDPWRKRLTDAARLKRVLETAGAELVLHGHGHQGRIEQLPTPRGAIPIVQGSSASSAATDPVHAAAWTHCVVTGDAQRFRVEITRRAPSRQGRPPASATHVFELPRGSGAAPESVVRSAS